MKFFSYVLVYRRLLLVVFTVLILLPLPLILRSKVSEPGEQAGGFSEVSNCPLLLLCNYLSWSWKGGDTLGLKSGWLYIVLCPFLSLLMINAVDTQCD